MLISKIDSTCYNNTSQLIQQTLNMFHLPEDIINYIYTFDDNIYAKRQHKQTMIELKSRHKYFKETYDDCIRELKHYNRLYQVYYDVGINMKRKVRSLQWYLLDHSKYMKNQLYKNGLFEILLWQKKYRDSYTIEFMKKISGTMSYRTFIRHKDNIL